MSAGRVLTVSSDDVVADVTAQACLQGGLAAVFQDLLDFEGDELYFTPVPELAGHTYAEGMLAFEQSSVIGRLRGDGVVELNPAPASILAADDELIVVAEDDATALCTGLVAIEAPEAGTTAPIDAAPGHIVLVGWSSFGAKVLRELDEFLPEGSLVEVVVDTDLVDPDEIEALGMEHAALRVRRGDGGPDDLMPLDDRSTPAADHRARVPGRALDRRCRRPHPAHPHHPARHLAARCGGRARAHRGRAARPAEPRAGRPGRRRRPHRQRRPGQPAHGAALRAGRAPVRVRRAVRPGGGGARAPGGDGYVSGREVSFAEVVAAGARVGTSPFGYRIAATGTVVVNPPKAARCTLGPGDQVIVVATRS